MLRDEKNKSLKKKGIIIIIKEANSSESPKSGLISQIYSLLSLNPNSIKKLNFQ